MDLSWILILAILALSLGALASHHLRLWGLLVLSVFALYWLQPLSALRHYAFWLPTLTLLLSIGSWLVTRGGGPSLSGEDRTTLVVLFALVLLVASTRFLPSAVFVTVERPPPLASLLPILLASIILLLSLRVAARRSPFFAVLVAGVIVFCFFVLKADQVTVWASKILRNWNGQEVGLAVPSDLSWLGFSYITLRLLHTLLDRLAGKLHGASLREYISYVIFFPTLSAGPIARLEGFADQLRRGEKLRSVEAFKGGRRVLLGLVKKFILADSLGLIAINATSAYQVREASWMWILLYAYALQIYLDFSGYTDIALGIGQLAGVELPENFNRPYLQPNIRMFWNSWHITLAHWFRTHYFNPLTRRLRRLTLRIPEGLMVFFMHLSTMALIGLWHGVRWNFFLWGVWHGIGLFIHNRWSAVLRSYPSLQRNPWLSSKVGRVLGVGLTFQFVVLGWVLFAFTDLEAIGHTLRILLGMSSTRLAGG